MARYPLARSEGTIGELARLLTEAVVAAVDSGEEAIYHRTPILADYAGPHRAAPPVRTRTGMKPAARWPLHLAPPDGEALSSWLRRIALVYDMDTTDLMRHGPDDPAPPSVGWTMVRRRPCSPDWAGGPVSPRIASVP